MGMGGVAGDQKVTPVLLLLLPGIEVVAGSSSEDESWV
jgi:hypothetical protein